MIRLDQVNTFWYEGTIIEFRDAEARIKDNRLYAARYITIQNKIGERRISKVIMCLPKAFESKRVASMQRNAVQARFHFCIRFVKGDGGGAYNIIQCLSIEPKEGRDKHLRQKGGYDQKYLRPDRGGRIQGDLYRRRYARTDRGKIL